MIKGYILGNSSNNLQPQPFISFCKHTIRKKIVQLDELYIYIYIYCNFVGITPYQTQIRLGKDSAL